MTLAWDFSKHHEQHHVRDFIDCITIEGTAMVGCQTYHDTSTTVLKIGGLGQHRGGECSHEGVGDTHSITMGILGSAIHTLFDIDS